VTVSIHQAHELLLKLEQAGLSPEDAQAVIESGGNALAEVVVSTVRGFGEEFYYPFKTSALTLKELWELNQDLLGQDCWWRNEPFANVKGTVGKLLLRSSAVLGSFGKNWGEQQTLLSSGDFVPGVRDVIEGMIAYYRDTGMRLFPNYWVRTIDVSSCSDRVCVWFSPGRLLISGCWDEDRLPNVGLAVVRKAPEL